MFKCLQKLVGRLNGRLQLIFVALIVLTLLGLLLTYKTHTDIRYCFMDTGHTKPLGFEKSSIQRLDDILLAAYKPPRGRSIFFHETSCHRKPNTGNNVDDTLQQSFINLVQLTKRQACAIESAALHNPNLSIFVLFASPTYHDNTTAKPVINAILSYPNVHLRNLNLWTYAAGTPIYKWLKDGQLFESHYVLSHISDFLRYLTLWRWGGTYLDLDVIMLRSIEDVPPNYTGAESNTHLAAGVMNLAADGFGHEIAEQCLQDFQRNFKGHDWGNNGPGVITRVMQHVCSTKNIALMLEPKRCMGFHVYPRDAFYAIGWLQWEQFFEPQHEQAVLEQTKQSYVVHVWNKHSKNRNFTIGAQGAYGKLTAAHCPKVYAAAGDYI